MNGEINKRTRKRVRQFPKGNGGRNDEAERRGKVEAVQGGRTWHAKPHSEGRVFPPLLQPDGH